jgi:hypothetical protein
MDIAVSGGHRRNECDGFGFPFHRLLPAHVVGAISLVVLAVAFFARYSRHLVGRWRRIYVITAMLALHLNVFVLVVQLFQKVPALAALAPTQSEPPFVAAQLVVLALLPNSMSAGRNFTIVIGIVILVASLVGARTALRRHRPEPKMITNHPHPMGLFIGERQVFG